MQQAQRGYAAMGGGHGRRSRVSTLQLQAGVAGACECVQGHRAIALPLSPPRSPPSTHTYPHTPYSHGPPQVVGSPPESMVHTFFELMPSGSPSDFQRILDLKVQCKRSTAQRGGAGSG